MSNIFETLIFIFLGIGFFSFKHPYGSLNPLFIVLLIILILAGRFLNVYLCSKITNITRQENTIDLKKGFFLWFSGVRGAMAFALAIKSKLDFPKVGPIFLVLTLIVISFTLIYSTIFLDFLLKKCDIINICEADNFESSNFNKNLFETFKRYLEEINKTYLKPFVTRENRESSDRINLNPENIANNPIENQNKIEIKNRINNKEGVMFFEKKNNEDVTIDKRNFQIKNIHLFE